MQGYTGVDRYYVSFNHGYWDIKRGTKTVEVRTSHVEAKELKDRLNEGL